MIYLISVTENFWAIWCNWLTHLLCTEDLRFESDMVHKIIMVPWLNGLQCRPVTARGAGSNPIGTAIGLERTASFISGN